MNNTVYTLSTKQLFSKNELSMGKVSSQYVRIKNLFCGICGGDYSSYIGRRNQYNISLGHEFVSEIIELGNDVKNFVIGDLVVSDLNYRCGECSYCKQNKSHLCDENNIQKFSNRAFAYYSDIESSYLVKANSLKDNVVAATCVEPLSCVIHAIDMTLTSKTKDVLLVGCGNIGMLMAFYLKIVLKIDNVYVTDIIENKMNNLIELFSCIPYDNKSKLDFVIEATSDIHGLDKAIGSCTKGGKICSMSHLYGIDTSFIYEPIVKNEINIIFPLRNGIKKNLDTALHYITEYWEYKYNSMFEIHPLQSINQAFQNKENSLFNKQIIQI